MKNIFKFRIVTAVCAIAMIGLTNNCTNLTDNLSTDPVNITNGSQVPTANYISGVEVSLMGVYEGDIARLSGLWAQYFDGEDRQYTGLYSFVTSGQDYDQQWVTIYTAIFNNTKIIKSQARALNNNSVVGLAQVIEGMCIGTAADMWGDVPYSQISQYPKITTPKFDTQASVYADAQVLLDSAIANLQLSGSINSTADFLYSGSTANWIAAAHTVKARLYLHTRDYANAIIHANQGISSASGNMMAPHGSAYGQTFNLYYSFLTYDRPGYMADNAASCPTFLDVNEPNYRGNAKTNENGRLNYYFAPAAYWGGLNTGAKYDPNVLCNFDWGTPIEYDGFFGGVTSFPILTFQENQLILAEAYMKQAAPDPTNALAALNSLRAYYNTGAQYGTSTGYISDPDLGGGFYLPYVLADFAPAGMDNNGTDTQNQALLREILEERYFTLIGQIEGYTDMRRTGNFLNTQLPPGKTDFPRRYLYSQIETNTNPNCAALIATGTVGLYDPVASFSTPY